MKEHAPCRACIKRCLLCHSHCDEYAEWAKRMAERKKRPKYEIDANFVEFNRGKRIRREQQERWKERHK